jgi:hypothetical protein
VGSQLSRQEPDQRGEDRAVGPVQPGRGLIRRSTATSWRSTSTVFAAKPEPALAMISRALDAGTPVGWVSGDEVYGADPGLRAGLEDRKVCYVLAVAKSHPVATSAGAVRADALARRLPPRAWQLLSAGPGARGHRWYDWAWVSIDPGRPGHHWLLIRRHRRTRELAYYRCYSPRHVSLAVLVRAAGRRWTVEEDFQGRPGPGRPRRAPGTALGLLVPVGHPGHPRAGVPHRRRADRARPATATRLIPLTRNEIARLAAAMIIQPGRDARSRLRWSGWRRRHQHTAPASTTSARPPTTLERHDLHAVPGRRGSTGAADWRGE